ncbi:MAG: 2-oxo acid dehydrogenase subunit, partial [Rhodococcus erythropolis]|nr:2-oxo acid dehydrogenase subunit [Rhodococcus erythropolis]
MTSNRLFTLPDVGEGLTEAEITKWFVSVGDTVTMNDTLVEIETAKSAVELPSPYAGVVHSLLVPEGDIAAVGTPIIEIGDAVAADAGSAP